MCQDIFVTSPAWLHERLILRLLLFVSLESLLQDFICRHSSKHSGFTAAFDMENMQPMLVIEVPTKDRTKSKFMRLQLLDVDANQGALKPCHTPRSCEYVP